MRRLLPALALLAPLAACKVGPNYAPPREIAPARFGEAADVDLAQPAPTLSGWWHVYADPELDRLIALALADGPDAKIAVSRIAQARAAERVARSGLFPQVNAQAGANYLRFSKNAGLSNLTSLFGGGGGAAGGGAGGGAGTGGIALPGDSITTYSTGFDASWELDVFGGTQRQLEGARARVDAAVFDARDAQLSLIAEVADAYFQLRTLQDRERIARTEVDRQQRNLDIAQNTARAGLIAQGDFIRQRAELASAEVGKPDSPCER